MFVRYHFNVASYFVCRLIKQEEYILNNRFKGFIQICVQILSMFTNQVKFIVDIENCINFLVQGQAFYLIHTFFSIVKTNVKELQANLLKFVNTFGCWINIDIFLYLLLRNFCFILLNLRKDSLSFQNILVSLLNTILNTFECSYNCILNQLHSRKLLIY